LATLAIRSFLVSLISLSCLSAYACGYILHEVGELTLPMIGDDVQTRLDDLV